MLYDFIEIYDLDSARRVAEESSSQPILISVDWVEVGEKNCERIIEFFESVYDEKSSKDSGLAYFNKNRQKVCATKTFDFSTDNSINDPIYYFIKSALESYTKKYGYLNTINKASQWRLCPFYNVQRYDGEKEGFFALHNEHSGSYPYRMLAWMVYLNNAKCGTEFPYQEKIVTPKVGRTAIWPAGWTHPHKGVTPNEGLKYIATGWFYFLPKGKEPKFDGRHPDETKIQEIVI